MIQESASNSWLLIAARVYTRELRAHLNAGRTVSWSAPGAIKPGDLALLYEMGKPEVPGDLPGRMQVDWLLRAASSPSRDRDWKWVADFEGIPLRRPLSLAEAKRSRLFADGPGKSLQGRHRYLDRPTWVSLSHRIDRLNPDLSLAAALTNPPALDRLFASGDLSVVTDDSDDRDFSDHGAMWRTEAHLRKDAADLIDQERWTHELGDLQELGLMLPGASGYHLGDVNLYVDDILRLDTRHLVVVEYEKQAHGGNHSHGARQAANYRRELRERLPGYTIDGLVIAAVFGSEELAVASRLGIECLRIERRGRRALKFTQLDDLAGPVRRARAAVQRRPKRAFSLRLPLGDLDETPRLRHGSR
jgi:hypothetical protein